MSGKLALQWLGIACTAIVVAAACRVPKALAEPVASATTAPAALATSAPAADASAGVVEGEGPIEEVLVTGQQPGPGLWKVTRPDDPRGHVLWLLGNYSPLPKGMAWRPGEVESVIHASQAVLAPPKVDPDVGPLGGITLLPSLIGVRDNPDDKRLQDVVSPQLYARWLPLKARYLGNDDKVEQWRPIFAAQELYKAALKKRDLVPYDGVWPEVKRIARKADVRVVDVEIEVKVAKARAAIKEFKSTPLDDTECFARTLQRLESDMDLMRERANAWAVGDVATLRRLAPVERASACIAVVLDTSVVRERGLGDVVDRVRSAWVQAATSALENNASTLAVVPLDEILKPDGAIATLRKRGYTIEAP